MSSPRLNGGDFFPARPPLRGGNAAAGGGRVGVFFLPPFSFLKKKEKTP